MSASRREFLFGMAAAGVVAKLSAQTGRGAMSCPFRLSVINDEISQDFDHACQVAAQDFGLSWIELRGMWNKNITDLNAKEIADAQQILEKYKLRVTDIASPLFKVDWPGAPLSKKSPKRDQFHADFDFKQQDALLDRCIELAKAFQHRPHPLLRLLAARRSRSRIAKPSTTKLREAAQTCAKSNIILLLENEMSCNTGYRRRSCRSAGGNSEPNFMLNWDPGNAATFPGNTPYPNGYNLLPKERIGHCHCKDVKRKPDGKYEWAPVGAGVVDWVGQFRALKRDGYHYAVSLETHWRGAGTPEASTRISMQGLKDALKKANIAC